MNIFRKVWAIWAFFAFFVLNVIIFPFMYIGFLIIPERFQRYLIWFEFHVIGRLFFLCALIFIKTEGKSKLDRHKAYMVVSNHQTSIDFIANAVAFPGMYRFLAKAELKKVPVFGFIVKKMCILVDRTNLRSRAKSIIYMKKVLESGVSVFIYPEGTRNKTGESLNEFHDGAFKLAIQAKAPIAIETILNMKSISNPSKELDLCPGILRIRWSEPLETAHLKADDADNLKEKVRNIMLEELQKG